MSLAQSSFPTAYLCVSLKHPSQSRTRYKVTNEFLKHVYPDLETFTLVNAYAYGKSKFFCHILIAVAGFDTLITVMIASSTSFTHVLA